jgi:hypothetical protein
MPWRRGEVVVAYAPRTQIVGSRGLWTTWLANCSFERHCHATKKSEAIACFVQGDAGHPGSQGGGPKKNNRKNGGLRWRRGTRGRWPPKKLPDSSRGRCCPLSAAARSGGRTWSRPEWRPAFRPTAGGSDPGSGVHYTKSVSAFI